MNRPAPHFALLLVLLGGCQAEGLPDFATSEQGATPSGPDFVVTRIGGPVSALGPFQGSVEVCNQGNRDGLATTVEIYLSRDRRISGLNTATPDPYAGSFSIGALAIGQCRGAAGTLNAAVPADGRYVLGALVDPDNLQAERREGNNTLAGDFIYSGTRPELFIPTIQTPRFVMSFFDPFEVSLRVCNQGTIASRASYFGIYASEDPTITRTDTTLEYLPTPVLQPGECLDHVGTYSYAPANGTTRYLGAIVDPFKREGELNESNNLTEAEPTIEAFGSDLSVERVWANPPSDPNSLEVRVCNHTAFPGSSGLELYWSPDPVITTIDDPSNADQLLATVPPFFVPENACTDVEVVLPGFGMPTGNGHLGVYLRDNQLDLDPSNDLWSGPRQGFGRGNDLLISKVTTRNTQSGVEAEFTVCNAPTDPYNSTPATTLQVYLSDDPVLELGVPWADPAVGNVPVPANWGAHCSVLRLPLANPSSGDFWLFGVVDEANAVPEVDEENNQASSAALRATAEPDLVIADLSLPFTLSDPFAATLRVCNLGQALAPPSTAALYFSHGRNLPEFGTPAPADVEVGSVLVSALGAGECVNTSGSFALPSLTGSLTPLAVADRLGTVSERSEDNNVHRGAPVGVGLGADLVVTEVQSTDPSFMPWVMTVSVCNRGTAPSVASQVALYFSRDKALEGRLPPSETGDIGLGFLPVPGLDPGRCASVTGPAYFAGSVVVAEGYAGAIINQDGAATELSLGNNGLLGSRVVLSPFWEDFEVSVVSLPESFVVDPFWRPQLPVQVRVCNRGGRSVAPQVELYASADGTGGRQPSDLSLGYATLAPLAPGACEDGEFDLASNPGAAEGSYWLAARVQNEAYHSGGTTLGPRRAFGLAADLAIGRMEAILSGDGNVVASVELCNQGGGLIPASSLQLYLSEDQELQIQAGGLDPLVATILSPSLGYGECTWTRTAILAAPSDRPQHLVAIASLPSGPDANPDNDLKFGPTVPVGNLPDLELAEFQAAGGDLSDVQLRVCNLSTAPAGPTTAALYASADGRLDLPGGPWAPDTLLDERPVPALDPQACRTVAWTWAGPLPAGQLFAQLDPANLIAELDEGNNLRTATSPGSGAADLLVENVTLPARLTAPSYGTVRVCNQGLTGSNDAYVTLHAAAAPTVTPVDQVVGQFLTGYLAPRSCQVYEVPVSPPSLGPAYRVGALVEPLYPSPTEDQRNNFNIEASFSTASGLDLVVIEALMPDLGVNGIPVAFRACNVGDEVAYAEFLDVEMRIQADSDPFSPGNGISFGVFEAPTLWPEECGWATFGFTDTAIRGEVFLSVLNGPWSIDANPYNGRLELGAHRLQEGPDRRVTSVVPNEVEDAATVRICNDGTTASDAATVTLYATADLNPEAYRPVSSEAMGSAPVPSLAPAACVDALLPISATAELGPRRLVAALSDLSSALEPVVSNNLRVGPFIGGGSGADWIVRSIEAPETLPPDFAPSIEVCNIGNEAAPPTQVAVYLSLDEHLDGLTQPLSGDGLAGMLPVPALSEGGCAVVSGTLLTPAPGNQVLPGYTPFRSPVHLWAAANPQAVEFERNPTNNALLGPVVGYGAGPDLYVASVLTPPSAAFFLEAAATVCNGGTWPAGPSATALRLTLVAGVPYLPYPGSQWTELAVIPTPGLAPGACIELSDFYNLPPGLPNGAYLLTAVADVNNELVETLKTNNRLARELSVGAGPDFYVEDASWSLGAFGDLTVTATVCNQGTYGEIPMTTLYLSTDDQFEDGYSQTLPPDEYWGDFSFPGPIDPGFCQVGTASVFGPPSGTRWGFVSIIDFRDINYSNGSWALGSLTFP